MTSDTLVRIMPLLSAPEQSRNLFLRAPDPEGSWPWFEALARTTLTPGEEAVLAQLGQAALPLVRLSGGRYRALTAPYTTLYAPALGSAEQAFALGQGLKRSGVDSLRLDCLDEDNPLMEAFIRGGGRAGFVSARYRHFANFYDEGTDFASFWESREGKLQNTVRRKTKQVARDHICSYEIFSTPGEIPQAIDIYEEIYASSWKEAEPDPDFIRLMAMELAEIGAIRLGIMRIDGVPAAAQIWLIGAARATIFKLAHSPTYERLSPGTLLSHWLLQQVMQEGVRCIDFGRGDDPYKRNWLQRRRYRQGAIVSNSLSLVGMNDAIRYVLPTRLSQAFKGR